MNRSIIKYLTVCVFMIMSTTVMLSGQDPVPVNRSNNKVVIEGNVYYVHVVKPGQTLYSIARAYNVSEKEIVIENPGITADLRIAQVLKIPEKPAAAFSVLTVEPEDGKKKHTVQHGETIYSISREHNCTVEMIIQLNPDLDIDDLQIGQTIIIPSVSEERNELSFDEEGFIFHKVKRRETLYSISRYYGVSISEIKSVNARIGWGGPRIGEIIKIPNPNTSADVLFSQDSISIDSLDLGLDSLLMEEYTYEELKDSYFFDDDVFNIAYLIPFDFTKQDPLDSLLKDVKSPVRRERIIEQYKMVEETPQAVQFLEFFEGSMLAIDTLTDAGLTVRVHFFDTRKSMSQTKTILERPEMEDMDMVFGPFYTYNLELVSEYCRIHHIPVITPFHSDDSLVLSNPYLYQLTPTYKTEYKKNAKYLSRSYDDNLIFIHSGDSAQAEKIEFYKTVMFSELEHYAALEGVLFKEVIVRDGNMEDLLQALNPDMQNTVILPETDEAFASQVASTLFYRIEDYDIQIFGSPFWVGFDDIEIKYIHDLNLTISQTHKYDFLDSRYLHMLEKFRENYFKEPSSSTRRGYSFGMLGYDVSLYFLSALKDYGPRFIFHLDDFKPAGMLTEYCFERLTPSSGYENQFLKYYHYDKDMNVYEVSLPEMPEMHHHLKPAEDEPYSRWFEEERSDTIKINDR